MADGFGMPLGKDELSFVDDYFSRLSDILRSIDSASVAQLFREIRQCYKREGVGWFFGNGGKAAIAQEWANDLSNGVRTATPAFRMTSLADNGPMITAIANDFDYSEIYSRQISIYARPSDLCVGMSGSGHSLNVLEGLRVAKKMGLRTVGIVGMDGGRLKKDYGQYADVVVHIPSDRTEDGPIEDVMLALCHLCVARFRHEN